MGNGRRWTTGLLAVLAISGCGIQYRPRQQFAGKLTSKSNECPAMKATLVIQGGKLVFSPGDGTWVLPGDQTGDRLSAERTSPGVDHKPYRTTLAATVRDAGVAGTYTTPSCTYDVDLKQY